MVSSITVVADAGDDALIIVEMGEGLPASSEQFDAKATAQVATMGAKMTRVAPSFTSA